MATNSNYDPLYALSCVRRSFLVPQVHILVVKSQLTRISNDAGRVKSVFYFLYH